MRRTKAENSLRLTATNFNILMKDVRLLIR